MDVYTEEYVPGDSLIHFEGKLYEPTEPGLFDIENQYDVKCKTQRRTIVRTHFQSGA